MLQQLLTKEWPQHHWVLRTEASNQRAPAHLEWLTNASRNQPLQHLSDWVMGWHIASLLLLKVHARCGL